MDTLNPTVRSIISESGRKLTDEDIDALKKISIRDIAKYYEHVGKGMTKSDSLAVLLQVTKERVAKPPQLAYRPSLPVKKASPPQAPIVNPKVEEPKVVQPPQIVNVSEAGEKDKKEKITQEKKIDLENLKNKIFAILVEALREKDIERVKSIVKEYEHLKGEDEEIRELLESVMLEIESAHLEKKQQIESLKNELQGMIEKALEKNNLEHAKSLIEQNQGIIDQYQELKLMVQQMQKKIQEKEFEKKEKLGNLKTEFMKLVRDAVESGNYDGAKTLIEDNHKLVSKYDDLTTFVEQVKIEIDKKEESQKLKDEFVTNFREAVKSANIEQIKNVIQKYESLADEDEMVKELIDQAKQQLLCF